MTDDDVTEWMDGFINTVMVTYEREIHRYRDLVERVKLVIPTIVGGKPVAVQDRVKSPASLRKKLEKGWQEQSESKFVDELKTLRDQLTAGGDPLITSVAHDAEKTPQQRVLDAVPDLAGIRLVVYRSSDNGAVVTAAEGSLSEVEWEDGEYRGTIEERTLYRTRTKTAEEFRAESGGTYEAVHLRLIYLTQSSLDPTELGGDVTELDPFAHLNEARCELQITTMTRHLLNEVGHDVLYKRNEDASEQVKSDNRNTLRVLADFLTPVDTQINALYQTVTEPVGRRGSRLAESLFPDPKPFSQQERQREWIARLVEYGEQDENLKPVAARVLRDKRSLQRELKRRRVDLEDVAAKYRDIYKAENDFVYTASKALTTEDPDQAQVLKVLAVLPTEYLTSFVKMRGSHTATRGRPPLIVGIAEAFLASQSQ